MISKIRILELSDIHLGHHSTDTLQVIDSLNRFISDKPSMAEYDMIIIAGDLYDRLLHLSSPDIGPIFRWIYSLLLICKKYDIVLRILEGTPSHDNKQAKWIIDMNEESDIGCDVKYVDILSIEYISRFDIYVLYIPDEWNPDCSTTLNEVRNLMMSMGLDKVDFAVMHGQFDYQVPSHLLTRIPWHDSSAYLELVKYLIFIGHVHTHSTHERIIASGSTDRLRHGEEHEKGAIDALVHDNGEFSFTFLVNDNAKIYKTIDVSEMSVDDAITYINDRVSELPDESYVRVKTSNDSAMLEALKEMRQSLPEYVWSLLPVKSETVKKETPVYEKVVMDNLHPDTLPKLLRNRITGKYDEVTENKLVDLLKEIIDDDRDTN